VVHVLAQFGADEDFDADTVADHLDSVWDQLDFDANWLSATERIEAESALERFALWQTARSDRQLLGTEVPFSCDIDLGDERVRLTGTADRVERDALGRIRIVDFKTGRRPPTAADIAVQDQLGVYQLAVAEGAFAEVTGPDPETGGAELVYLRLPEGKGPLPKVFEQAALSDVPSGGRMLVCARRDDHLALWTLTVAGAPRLDRLADATAANGYAVVSAMGQLESGAWCVLASGTKT
jgi:RecB family exonuclease